MNFRVPPSYVLKAVIRSVEGKKRVEKSGTRDWPGDGNGERKMMTNWAHVEMNCENK